MSVIPVTQAAELLEALIRHAMAEHAQIVPRGFDSERKRATIRAEIDGMLDKLADMRS